MIEKRVEIWRNDEAELPTYDARYYEKGILTRVFSVGTVNLNDRYFIGFSMFGTGVALGFIGKVRNLKEADEICYQKALEEGQKIARKKGAGMLEDNTTRGFGFKKA